MFWWAGQLVAVSEAEPAGARLSRACRRDRRGQTGQVHNAMFNFGANGELKWNFDGGDLLQGETDGSSYMNGGLRVRRASPTRTPD